MLSMFKGKKGFSVLFRNTENSTASPSLSADTDAGARRSSRVSGTVSHYTGEVGAAQLQCQRCSKRFATSVEDQNEGQSCCHRCGYPTCLQCREPVAGTPPWVCCVCDGSKSFMWLLEKTKMGPRLVSKIVEFCDPRGQRLMRSMLRFTLQQYRSESSPRPSLTIGTDGRFSGRIVSPSSCPVNGSQTPPSAAITVTSKPRMSGQRTSGERRTLGVGLSAQSANQGNVHRSSPYSHPKHASLQWSADRLNAAERSAAGEGKENSPLVTCGAMHVSESPKRPRVSEVLRRDDAVALMEYSPEPNRQVLEESDESSNGTNDDLTPTPPQQKRTISRAENRCAAVQDIYRASDSSITPRSTLTSGPKAEKMNASPNVRPSGHTAFQREALHQVPPNNRVNGSSDDPATPVEREMEEGKPKLDFTMMCVVAPEEEEPGGFGRSFSRVSSGSGRSESPAPRFPSFTQFLDDQAAIGAGQTHLPRESDVLVTVSPDSSEGDEGKRESDVIELGGTRNSRLTVRSSNKNNATKSGVCTPRGTQLCTPPSAADSSSRRHERHTRGASGLNGEFTPTRVLDMSVRQGSSSCRRNTRGSLAEMHAPRLYGSGGGAGRRSGQIGDSPFMYDLPSQFNSSTGGGGRVASACGSARRLHAQLATRTAGRLLGGGGGGAHDVRTRLARQSSRAAMPLQRVPSGTRTMARTNSSTAQFTRKNSATTVGSGYGRVNSGAAHLTRTPSSCTRLAGVPLSPNGRAVQHTASTTLVRTASSASGLPRHPVEAPTAGAPLERTHSYYGLAGKASPLKRTLSHTELSDPSRFCRIHSVSAFKRSATATAAFTRTNSINVFGRGAAAAVTTGTPSSSASNGSPHQRSHGAALNAFGRTATGTYLHGGRGRHVGSLSTRPAALTSRLAAVSKSAYVLRRGEGGVNGMSDRRLPSARRQTPISHPGAASPLHRTNTASRNPSRAVAGARLPTPTGFTRTATNTRPFERQLSRQHQQHPVSGGVRSMVNPAPVLVGVTRHKAAGDTARLRHTPSAMMRTDPAAVVSAATPRTPRPYIISSVSTAATPAATSAHSGARPVLSSSNTATPKRRSARNSLVNGSVGTTRTSGSGDALSPVSNAPIVRVPGGVALADRASAPRRRPAAASGAVAAATTRNTRGSPIATGGVSARTKGGAFTRLGTGIRSATTPTRGASRAAHPSSDFKRLNSRPAS